MVIHEGRCLELDQRAHLRERANDDAIFKDVRRSREKIMKIVNI